MTTIGRNDPCPCGSGRKYKHCCLRSDEVVDHRAARLRADEASVIPALLEFAATFYDQHVLDEAWDEFFVGVDAPPLEVEHPLFDALFAPWFLFEFVPDPMRRRKRQTRVPHGTVAAEYLQAFPQKFDESQRQFVEASLGAATSFHLVTGVSQGQSLDLEDLLTGARWRVRERSGSTTLRPGAVLFGRVVAIGNSAIMSGCAPLVLPPLWRIEVMKLRDSLAQEPGQLLRPDDVRLAAPRLLDFFHYAVHEIVNPQPPKLVNTDREPIEPTTLRFTLRCSVREAFDRLKTLSLWRGDDAMEDPEYDRRNQLRSVSISWSKRGNRIHKEWDNTSLGHLKLERSRLSVFVNSRRRATRIRRQIERRLGPDVSFKSATIESIERAVRDGLARRRGSDPMPDPVSHVDATPPELQAQVEEMLARRWAQWVDDRIPALGDLTPREAAASPSGRQKLEALLADYEWHNASRPANLRVDVDRLRQAAGLPVR